MFFEVSTSFPICELCKAVPSYVFLDVSRDAAPFVFLDPRAELEGDRKRCNILFLDFSWRSNTSRFPRSKTGDPEIIKRPGSPACAEDDGKSRDTLFLDFSRDAAPFVFLGRRPGIQYFIKDLGVPGMR